MVTAGRPTDADVYVLDRYLELVPVGIPGEIFVGGRDLARGYYGRPDLTAERFVDDPFAAEAGTRLFRTGDMARWCTDGRLQYLGRVDHQVKIRGCRVELGEVSAALGSHQQVREAVTVAKRDDGGEARLIAYYIPKGKPPTPYKLRRHLAALIPDYMIPAAFVPLEQFPLDSHGKIDQPAMPDVSTACERVSLRGGKPQGEIEQTIAEIWCNVAGWRRVGRDDHFFEIGGHSLAAMRVIAAVRDRLGVDVALKTFLARPTLRQFAQEAARHPAGKQPSDEDTQETKIEETVPDLLGRLASSEAAKLRKLFVDATVPVRTAPLSAAQRRLWYLHLMNPHSLVYNVASAFEIHGEFDVQAMRRSLEVLVRRHEVLRSVVVAVDGEPMQASASPMPIPLPVKDLSGVPGSQRTARARKQMIEIARQPIDLLRPPHIRARLLLLEPGRYILVLVLQHFVCDGWSRWVIYRELSEQYAAFVEGRRPVLPELSIQYADFAGGEKRWLKGRTAAAALRSWKGRFLDLPPPLELPGETPTAYAVAGSDFENAGESVLNLSATLTSELRQLSGRESSTLFMTLFAAFALLMGRLSGSSDVVIGSPVMCRKGREEDLLIGCFVNMVPLRLDVAGAPAFVELLARARAVVEHALTHSGVPFDALVEAVNPVRQAHRNPLFEVAFNYVNFAREPLRLKGLKVRRLDIPETGAKFDLNCYVIEEEKTLRLKLVYRSAIYSKKRSDRILAQYEALLQQIVAAPGLSIDRFSLITPAYRSKRPILELPIEAPVHEPVCSAFRRIASGQTQEPALSAGSVVRSYGQLASDAASLSHVLHGRGFLRGECVAVIGRRCPGLITAVLAVLESGGVLLLVDEMLPARRRRSMIEQAQARHSLRILRSDGSDEGDSAEYDLYLDPISGLPEGCGAASSRRHRQWSAIDANDRACIFSLQAVQESLRV